MADPTDPTDPTENDNWLTDDIAPDSILAETLREVLSEHEAEAEIVLQNDHILLLLWTETVHPGGDRARSFARFPFDQALKLGQDIVLLATLRDKKQEQV